MGIKSAKSNFTKDDVIDILKQNVTLYKDEPEFVEYIVNLALYLIDQACLKAGDRPETMEEIMQGYEAHRARKAAEAEKREKAALAAESIDLEDELEEKPPTNKLRLAAYDAVFKYPPTDDTEAEENAHKSDDDEIQDEDFDAELPRTRQLPSVGIMTPEPEGGLDKGPRIQVDQTGRTRIYKVIRSYTENKVADGTCPICGTHIGSASRCNACGHIL